MEKCARCRVKEDKVQLYDAIYEGRLTFLCERCSIIENIPLITKPDDNQIFESQRGIGVYERMKRLSGINEGTNTQNTFKRADRLKELDNDPSKILPKKEPIKLIEHFHWEILTNRRRKGLSQKQLAENLGEKTESIESLEKGLILADSERVVIKLEQYFNIKLRRLNELDLLNKSRVSKPVLLDSEGHILYHIPEPEIEVLDDDIGIEGLEIIEEKSQAEIDFEKRGEFDIKSQDISHVTIRQMREMHKKKIEATKEERKEEQRRIEERERLIEARKEELRMIKEKQSKDIDSMLGGAELLGKDKE
jgi:ribosome-binding protein aMBF1 (putative translation factor)